MNFKLDADRSKRVPLGCQFILARAIIEKATLMARQLAVDCCVIRV